MKYYYMHDTDMRHNRKVVALRRKFGIVGYGAWCMLLEILADADGNIIRWDDINRELYAMEMELEPEQLSEIVALCCRYGMLVVSDDTLCCPSLLERFASAAGAPASTEAPTGNQGRPKQVDPSVSFARSEAGRKGMASRWGNDNKTIANDNKTDNNDNKSNKPDNKTITTDNKHNKSDNKHNKNNKPITNITNGEILLSDPDNKMGDNRGLNNNPPIENENKNKNNNDDVVDARTRTCEEAEVIEAEVIEEAADPAVERLSDDVKRMAAESVWLNNVARMHHIPEADVKARLPDFVRSCIANGSVRHDGMRDLKSHFSNWLRIQLNQQSKPNTYYGTSTSTFRSAPAGTKADANAAVAAACRADIAAYLSGLAQPASDPF